ncbi:CIS tube protein [Candidatus Nitrospira bockiana]
MSGVPHAPRLVKGGLVLIDPGSSAVQRVITLQYNPDTLSRTLQTQSFSTGSEGGNRSEALRLKGPPVETIKLDAEIDATDQMELGDGQTAESGISPQLSALETIVYPSSEQLLANHALARGGTLEIAPMQAALVLFVWSKSRILPVRITDFSITEEAFDPNLNPIRAKVSLSLRVLSVDDLGFDTKGGSLFMIYQQQKEQLARQSRAGGLNALGIGGLP